MKNLVWDERLSLRNDAIDAQHQQIIKILQTLPDEQNEEFDGVFRTILRYTIEHFSEEENWMRCIDYPQITSHMLIHRDMTELFDRYLQHYVDGRLDVQAFKVFMGDWLTDHVLGEDMKIAEFLAAKES